MFQFLTYVFILGEAEEKEVLPERERKKCVSFTIQRLLSLLGEAVANLCRPLGSRVPTYSEQIIYLERIV